MERHMRSDVELDIQEKLKMINSKGKYTVSDHPQFKKWDSPA